MFWGEGRGERKKEKASGAAQKCPQSSAKRQAWFIETPRRRSGPDTASCRLSPGITRSLARRAPGGGAEPPARCPWHPGRGGGAGRGEGSSHLPSRLHLPSQSRQVPPSSAPGPPLPPPQSRGSPVSAAGSALPSRGSGLTGSGAATSGLAAVGPRRRLCLAIQRSEGVSAAAEGSPRPAEGLPGGGCLKLAAIFELGLLFFFPPPPPLPTPPLLPLLQSRMAQRASVYLCT